MTEGLYDVVINRRVFSSLVIRIEIEPQFPIKSQKYNQINEFERTRNKKKKVKIGVIYKKPCGANSRVAFLELEFALRSHKKKRRSREGIFRAASLGRHSI